MKITQKTARLAGFLVVGIFIAITSQAQTFLTNGLVAYYPFNGNVNDASGNGNDGTIVGSLSFGTNQFGQASSAINFSGTSNNYVTTSFAPPGNNSARTFSVWFDTASSNQHTLGTMLSYGIFDSVAGDGMDVGILSSGWLECDIAYFTTETSSSWIDGRWHHLVVVIPTNSTLNQITFFVDGVILPSDYVTPVAIQTVATPLLIGTSTRGDGYGSAYDYLGSMSNLRIYNRALSSNEVGQLYSYESAPPPPSFVTNGLVAYYPLNGNANDASGVALRTTG